MCIGEYQGRVGGKIVELSVYWGGLGSGVREMVLLNLVIIM